MRDSIASLLVLAAALIFQPVATAERQAMLSEDFLELSDSTQSIYVSGFLMGRTVTLLEMSIEIEEDNWRFGDVDQLICAPPQPEEVLTYLTAHIESDPSTHKQPFEMVALAALLQEYPCDIQ